MKKDKLKLLFTFILLSIILFIALIVSNKITNIALALVLTTFAIIISITIKRKKTLKTYKKQVNLFLIMFAILYVGLFYLLGLITNKFLTSPVLFSIKTLYRYIIPIVLIIISSEIIRLKLINEDLYIRIFKFNINISKIISFICFVIIDLIVYTRVYNFNNLDDFLIVIGFILFSSISCNLLYNYITVRYGIKGIIIYRIITSIYIYIIPVIPDIYIYFKAFLRMLYPYIIYLVIDNTYERYNMLSSNIERRKSFISITIVIIISTILTMLISCKFRYGILVIGSSSMKGSIDMGDAIIYERFDKQKIKKGQVIVFNKNNFKLVHRVVDIQNYNGIIKIYTKGDANKDIDNWYLTYSDIVGVVDFNIKYIGYPTIWINNLFN